MNNLLFFVRTPYEKAKKSENVKHLILMIVIFFLILPGGIKEYNLFSPNNKSSHEQ